MNPNVIVTCYRLKVNRPAIEQQADKMRHPCTLSRPWLLDGFFALPEIRNNNHSVVTVLQITPWSSCYAYLWENLPRTGFLQALKRKNREPSRGRLTRRQPDGLAGFTSL